MTASLKNTLKQTQTHQTHKSNASSLRCLIPGAIAALAIFAAAPVHALGDTTDNEWLPISESMVMVNKDSQLTRAEVLENLATWRSAGLLTPSNDIGDTSETLARREEFYALQTEVIIAEQQAVAQAAEAQAQLLAQAPAETEVQAQLQAQAESEALALTELRAAEGANSAMLQPSADGQLLEGTPVGTVLVVEIDD